MVERREVARVAIDRPDGTRINCMGAEHRKALADAKSANPQSSIIWHVDDGDGGTGWHGEVIIYARP